MARERWEGHNGCDSRPRCASKRLGCFTEMHLFKGGDVLVAVGLGRFAYIFPTKGREMLTKVYLKQKLNCVLMSCEEKALGPG